MDAKLKTALQFMKRLFNVNLKTRLLPISEFYNDAGLLLSCGDCIMPSCSALPNKLE